MSRGLEIEGLKKQLKRGNKSKRHNNDELLFSENSLGLDELPTDKLVAAYENTFANDSDKKHVHSSPIEILHEDQQMSPNTMSSA